MDSDVKQKLLTFLEAGKTAEAIQFIKLVKVKGKTRTQAQNSSYWLWLSMIEKEAENQGVTWDRIVANTHQLRVTSENLHEAIKQLIRALWGHTSTTQLEKTGQIEIVEQHVAELLGKVGLEVPPWPSEENKGNDTLEAMKIREKLDYPSN